MNGKAKYDTLFEKELGEKIRIEAAEDADAMVKAINATPEGTQAFGIIEDGKAETYTTRKPKLSHTIT